MTTQKSLAEQVGLDDEWDLSLENMALLLGIVEARFRTLELKSSDYDLVLDQMLAVGLNRINEVIKPTIDALQNIVDLGFLIAYSDSPGTLGEGNVIVFTIEDEEQRKVFTPSPRVSLSRVANYTDYAIAQVSSWDKDTGDLVVVVEAQWGNIGPFTDWVIGALPGDTYAAIQAAQDAFAARDLAKDWAEKGEGLDVDGVGTRSAKHYANAALTSASAAGGSASTASGAATTATGARDTAVAAKDLAVTKAAEAAASAASIIGGPLTSWNGKTGIVFSDPTAVTTVKATIDFRFTDKNGAPFPKYLTRGTVGGYRQRPNGTLEQTPINEPVIDFSAGTALGTGFYGAYTNLILYSEQLDNAAWTKTASSITPNAAVAPDGTTTADKIVESATTAAHSVGQGVTIGSVAMTAFALVKAAERSKCRLAISDNVSAVCHVNVDLALGTVTATNFPAHWTSGSASVTDVGSGWFLIVLTATSDQGTTKTATLYTLDNAGSSSYAGDGTSGLYAWGLELTATAFPVPYVPTTSAAVTRNADSMVISGTDFTDFFNPLEGTLYAEAIVPLAVTGSPVLAVFDSGASSNRIIIIMDAANSRLEISTSTSSVLQAFFQPSVTRGALIKVAFSFKANNFAASLNGATALTDSSGTMPSGVNRLSIGNVYDPWSEHISRLIYWPKALTATELQRMTA